MLEKFAFDDDDTHGAGDNRRLSASSVLFHLSEYANAPTGNAAKWTQNDHSQCPEKLTPLRPSFT